MSIPFDIPARFIEQLATGKITRYGTIFKDKATGHIVGHVQETGILQNALSNLSLDSFSPLGVLDLGASVVNSVKLSQLMGMVHALGVITVGFGVMGIGVSAASAALVLRRLGEVKGWLATLDEKISAGFEGIELREYERLFAKVMATLRHANVLSGSTDAASHEWRAVGSELDALALQALSDVQRKLKSPQIDIDVIEKLMFADLLCRGVAVQSLVRIDAVPAALAMARESNASHQHDLDALDPLALMKRQLHGVDADALPQRVSEASHRTHRFLAQLQSQRLRNEQQQILLEDMLAQNINGAEYLMRVEQEGSAPFLVFRAASVG